MIERTVSVGDLVRFCHRNGDIDHRFNPSPTGVEGITGHQRLYAQRPATYLSEYGVEYLHEVPGLALTLRGRADGYDPQQGLVEEIKTCRVAPDSIPEPVAQLHQAQGKVYAAIIAARSTLEQLAVRVTWLNIDSDQEHSQTERYSAAELAEFLQASLTEFSRWLQVVTRLQSERDDSLATLDFPYGGFREGQREIAELAYKCIDQGGQLLLEAPTGIGKTAAVLFPALKALDAAILQRALHREDIEELAQRFEVCPYELAQDLLPWVDVIIADIHYVYSLSAGLGSAMDTGPERWTLLVDEAHNLPGRARSMYSAKLGKAAVLAAKNTASGALQKALQRINRQFLALQQKGPWEEVDFHSSAALPQALITALQVFTAEVSATLAQEPAFLQRHPILMDFYFETLQFLRVAEQWGDDYRCQLSRDDGRQSLCVTLNCIDPSRLLAQRQQRAHAVNAFSATLSPLPWSRSSLGLELLAQKRNVAAFCILGGVFGEGIDLPGEQLSSVVVVGVGMPQVNRDTRQLQAWHAAQSGAGFEYTFLFPGMQKVDQALGRVVRSMTDRGAALLIDSRYRDPAYRQLLPRWWHYSPWLAADDTRT